MTAPGRLFWLASYPKSGNTWFRAFLANLLSADVSPVCINDMATGAIASSRHWLDEPLGFDTADLLPAEVATVRPAVHAWYAANLTQPAYHKIHDAYHHLPDGQPLFGGAGVGGALYIIRNPLDVVSSAASHWGCSVDEAIDKMANPAFTLGSGKKRAGSQVPQLMQSWSQHVTSWVDAPDLHCCVLRYEDMLAQPLATFGQAVDFLQLQAHAHRLEHAIACSDFKQLSRQEQEKGFKERSDKAERFFRAGKAGAWQASLSAAQIDRIIQDHGDMMRRFHYLDEHGSPCV